MDYKAAHIILNYVQDKASYQAMQSMRAQYKTYYSSLLKFGSFGGHAQDDNSDITPDSSSQVKIYTRYRDLASAIALIAPKQTGYLGVAACAIETTHIDDSQLSASKSASYTAPTPMVTTIRITQDNGLTEEERDGLQALVDSTVKGIWELDINALKKNKNKPRELNEILNPLTKELREAVASRCGERVKNMFSRHYVRWYESATDVKLNSPTRQDTVKLMRSLSNIDRKKVAAILEGISLNSKMDVKNGVLKEQLAELMSSANTLLDKHFDSFEKIWAAYEDTLTQSSYEIDIDEGELARSLLEEELDEAQYSSKSRVGRYVTKIARYQSACAKLVRHLAWLRRTESRMHPYRFEIATVPDELARSYESGTPSCTLKDYVEGIGLNVSKLDASHLRRLRQEWQNRQNCKLILHCEMQLVIFYALNPHLIPVGYFIAVNKLCCKDCCSIIKKLQQSAEHGSQDFTETNTEKPLHFAILGTHGKCTKNWLFPSRSCIPSKLATDLEVYERFCNRLDVVKTEMEEDLAGEAKKVLLALSNLDSVSDSEGEEDPSSAGEVSGTEYDHYVKPPMELWDY